MEEKKPLFESSFLVTEEDYIHYCDCLRKAQTTKSEKRLLQVLGFLLVLLGALGLVFVAGDAFVKLLFALGVVLGLGMAFYVDFIQTYMARKQSRHFFQTHQDRFVAQHISFLEDRMQLQSDRYEGEILYSELYRCVEDSATFVFFVGLNQAYFLPKRQLSSEEVQQLQTLLRSSCPRYDSLLPGTM